MRRLLRSALPVALCALVLASAADARPLLGVYGSMSRFQNLTGQRSDAKMRFFNWGQGYTYGRAFESYFRDLGDVPIFAFDTSTPPPKREKITPGGIAAGKGDRYLMAMNRAVNRWGRPIYIRPMAEMNGHWSFYCAYNANGTRRNAAHSTESFRRAFRRIYLILHGGDRATINAKLKKSGMPGISADLPVNPAPTLKVMWNPQGFGSPNVPGNSAAAYYPGNAYVDVVANDLYETSSYEAQWEANLKLYNAYPTKPFALGEFGLWGVDHPRFIEKMAGFARRRGRVELLVYYESEHGSVFDLASKPRARAAYKRYITPLNR